MSFLAFKLSDVVFIMLINVKMSTIVGILIFMSMINFMLSLVECEFLFISLGPGHTYFPFYYHSVKQLGPRSGY